MNKRHYEHTLPNIRGSLSNTYTHSSIYFNCWWFVFLFPYGFGCRTIRFRDYTRRRVVAYPVLWWSGASDKWWLTTLRHEVIESIRHRIVGEPGFRRFGYPFRQVSEEADFRVFECSVYHIFKSFVSWIMLQINKYILEPVSLLRQVAARCAGWQSLTGSSICPIPL